MNPNNKISFMISLLMLIYIGTVKAEINENTPVSPSDPQLATASAPIIAGGRLLKQSKIVSDNAVVTVDPGFQPIHAPTSLVCPSGTTKCTLGVEQHVQVRGASAGRWAICTKLDGAFLTEPSCPFLGKVPTDDSFIAGSFAQSARSLTQGTHTVQTFVYTDGGGSLSIYNLIYRIYQP